MTDKSGTNFLAPQTNGDTNVTSIFTNNAGDAILVTAPAANVPSAKAGYGIGCILINSTTGSPFVNVGTATSCLFLAIVS